MITGVMSSWIRTGCFSLGSRSYELGRNVAVGLFDEFGDIIVVVDCRNGRNICRLLDNLPLRHCQHASVDRHDLGERSNHEPRPRVQKALAWYCRKFLKATWRLYLTGHVKYVTRRIENNHDHAQTGPETSRKWHQHFW